jgi:hypothetical protein
MTDFGRDIAVSALTEDADDIFSEVTGVQLVRQDLRHRLLTDSVLGPDGADNGFDVRKRLGATVGTAAATQSRIKRVALKDQRIKSAAVSIDEATTGGLRSQTITVICGTALGPFRLVFPLDPSKPTSDLVTAIENQ